MEGDLTCRLMVPGAQHCSLEMGLLQKMLGLAPSSGRGYSSFYKAVHQKCDICHQNPKWLAVLSTLLQQFLKQNQWAV